jgi:hypothetical protein
MHSVLAQGVGEGVFLRRRDGEPGEATPPQRERLERGG